MLARQIECTTDTSGDEYFTVLVETNQSVIEFPQGFFIVRLLSGNVAKFKECSETADHVNRDMTFNGRKVYLSSGY
jgi:hypothetical protein